jgi:antitoxin component of RelBE/YafQ-DinJ toxin-antitoxin module
MDTTTLQVPLTKELKYSATSVAKKYGFSSLQEIVRVLLTKLSREELTVSVEQFPAVKLSAKNEKRYAKMEEDFKAGRNVYTANSVEEFLNELKK